MKELVAFASAFAAISSAIGIYVEFRHRRFKAKLRQALRDCIAFYQLEQLYCEEISAEWMANERGDRCQASVLAIKRIIRARLRAKNNLSPSAEATPQRMVEELSKLN